LSWFIFFIFLIGANGPGYPQGLFVLLPLKLAKNRIDCLAVLDFSFSGPCGIAFVMFAASSSFCGNSGRRSLGEALEVGQGERRAAFLAGGPCSLPPGLRSAPLGKWALEGARLYLYSKTYMEKPELVCF
jgi:hypothetical protein